MSAVVHLLIVLLLIFGLPVGNSARDRHPSVDATPIAIAHPLPPLPVHPKKATPKEEQPQPLPPPPPPPPPMKEVELGPDSKKPDEPAKEAAAKKSDQEAANTAATKAPDPKPVPPPAPPSPNQQAKPSDATPPAPRRIDPPKMGDYASSTATRPITSPFGPQHFDTSSAAPPPEPVSTTVGSMGRTGLSSHDPSKWENSFDDETAGQCPEIPDMGKNADGSPVLATVRGRVLDTDGRTPLAGARLQIVGTQFGTFSHDDGEYILSFDPHLLQKCRIQYVSVVAPGYHGESLKLMIGPRVRSPDLILHHGR